MEVFVNPIARIPRGCFVAAIVVIAVVACTRSQKAGAPSRENELRAVSDSYARSSALQSADSVVQYFADDVIVMSPQAREPIRGREPNRAAWERLFSASNPTHTMTSDSVFVAASGDMGYTLGKWTVGVDTPDGRVESAGDYLAVWRRNEKGWKITAISAYPFR